MKQLSLMLVSLALAVVLPAATYNNTLNGSQTASEAESITLNLTASGDLPGMNKITLQRDGQNVTGGSWRLAVLPQNADAASNARGELVGTISGGTLTLTAEGALVSASSVQVAIQSGTGEYAAVTSGTATLNISADAENASQLNGSLVLNF